MPWDGTAVRSPLAPLAWEVQQGRAKRIKELLSAHPEAIHEANKGRYNLVNVALTQKSSDVAQLLLEGGADPHLPDMAGLFPIHMAAMHGLADITATLIAAETSPNVETRNHGQTTPIFFAAQFDRTALVKLLLGKGADIKVGRQFCRAGSGIERQPPLYAAFERTKDGATPTLLIERGARIDERFPMGDEPIHLAARRICRS